MHAMLTAAKHTRLSLHELEVSGDARYLQVGGVGALTFVQMLA